MRQKRGVTEKVFNLKGRGNPPHHSEEEKMTKGDKTKIDARKTIWFDLLPRDVAERQALWERRKAIARAVEAERRVKKRGAIKRVADALGLSLTMVSYLVQKAERTEWSSKLQKRVPQRPPVEKFMNGRDNTSRLVSRATETKTYKTKFGNVRMVKVVTVHESP